MRGIDGIFCLFDSHLFSDANEIQNLLKTSTRMIPQHSCLSTALLAQDERCLSVAVALLRLEVAKM